MSSPKNRARLLRRAPLRQQYERTLVVCEGEKTEPNYLEEIKASNRIGRTVRIVGAGAGPTEVLRKAREEFARDRDYDRIFCVFDRDTHEDFNNVLQQISRDQAAGRIGERRARGVAFRSVISAPCFEYWLLLHFEFTDADLTSSEALARLRGHPGMAGYTKGTRGVYRTTQPRLENAFRHATQARESLTRNNSLVPVTEVDELVQYLNNYISSYQK